MDGWTAETLIEHTSPAPARAPASEAPREIILDGRRYLLVPAHEATSGNGHTPSGAERLTARELQIVSQVADGRVNKQIADTLGISEWTVSTHLRRVFAKLGVDTRAAMVSRCVEVIRKRV